MDLNLQGQSVARVCFDTPLVVLTSDSYELRVETEASFTTPEGSLISFHPESPGEAAIHLVGMNQTTISSATAAPDGELTVVFDDGSALTVAADPDYEAWGTVGPKGERVTCMPGGEFALWSSE
ncbi:DUF6188 family protein [Streptomyces sp. WZ-12]|uniref:DUF6188 family protein n=1 Tax=Streptomyces sp. WZ-12 TaxID=3030210 RepID=UPI0023815958|nr:DUF6188 family protein [Streptomyces sp. WZ-12]